MGYGRSWPNLDAQITSLTSSANFMTTRELDDKEASSDFPVTNVVTQGCVLVPTLYSMVFFDMLLDAFNKEDHGFYVNRTGKKSIHMGNSST